MCWGAREIHETVKCFGVVEYCFEAIKWEGRWRERWHCSRAGICYSEYGKSNESCRNIRLTIPGVGSLLLTLLVRMFNFALGEVLGNHVDQKGSVVLPEKMRFDFSHDSGRLFLLIS